MDGALEALQVASVSPLHQSEIKPWQWMLEWKQRCQGFPLRRNKLPNETPNQGRRRWDWLQQVRFGAQSLSRG